VKLSGQSKGVSRTTANGNAPMRRSHNALLKGVHALRFRVAGAICTTANGGNVREPSAKQAPMDSGSCGPGHPSDADRNSALWTPG
jgi:hypothetical protein